MDKASMSDTIWECIGKVKGVAGILNAMGNVDPAVILDNRQEICEMLFRELESVQGQLESIFDE